MNARLLAAARFGLPLAAVVWWFAPIVRRMTDVGDFPAHARFAQQIADGTLTIPHFGYQLLVIGAHALVPGLDWRGAGAVVTIAAIAAAAGILARWVGTALSDAPPSWQLAAAAAVPLALLIAQPVLGPGALPRDPWLIGSFPPNQMHNPTTILSKAPALVLCGFGARALFGRTAGAATVAACALLALMAGLIKPSYLMALLPAVGLIALARARRVDWRLVICGLALPAALQLAAQYLFYYRLGTTGQTVLFAPLTVIGLHSPVDVLTLGWKLIASILFPLAVAAAFPAVWSDGRVRLAWAAFGAGAAWGYLFAEGGGQADAGNFLWSGQLAAFVLFAATAPALLARVAAEPRAAGVRARAACCATVLAWHVVSGVRHLHASWYA